MTYKRIGAWTLTILLALEFVLVGSAKFTPASRWPGMFARWGYPAWVRPMVGVAELAGGLALLAPRMRKWASAALACIMIGAAVTLLFRDAPGRAATPIILLALIGLLAWISPR